MIKQQICKVKGYNNILHCYYCTDDGKIFSDNKEISLKQDFCGYYVARLNTIENKTNKNGFISHRHKNIYVHKLICASFHARYRKKGLEVHHVNRNKLDNRSKNLIYLTHEEHLKLHNKS